MADLWAWCGSNWVVIVIVLCAVERVMAVRGKAQQTLSIVVDAIESVGRAVAPASTGAKAIADVKKKIGGRLGESNVMLESAIEAAQPTLVEKLEHRPKKVAKVLDTFGAVLPLLSRLGK